MADAGPIELTRQKATSPNTNSRQRYPRSMPFLRALEVNNSLELRSSKTLIGSGSTTCDVVISGNNVLDLHALLNLSADKASAKLVPFSTTEAGVCYVNDVFVPREGVIVVHGDRLAFGDPRNVFLFELTRSPQMTASAQQSIETEKSVQHSIDQTTNASSNRAFRKALDALRGDRKGSTPNASVVASIQSNRLAARNRTSISSSVSSAPPSLKSKDQLSKFLLEASTDSLLSDYVERKLKQCRNRQSSPARSNQSESTRRASSGDWQSREQRNLAEVEKLRLSQQIQEVNDVLNGDMEFQESYLSPSAKNSRSQKPRWAVTDQNPPGRVSVLQSVEDTSVPRSEDDSDEDEEDELPAMMERAASLPKAQTPPSLSVSIQTEHSERGINSDPLSREEAGDENELLDYSLESVPDSEKAESQQQQPGSPSQSHHPPNVLDFFSKAVALGLNDLTRSNSRPIKMERQEAARTSLHDKLINQTIQRKQNEINSEAFTRWQRGLQVQSNNRKLKAQRLEDVRVAFGKLRRDQHFIRWRDYAVLSSQVIICRLEAFQRRGENRLVRKSWTALCLNYLTARQRSTLLRGLIIKKTTVMRHVAFRRWQQFVEQCSVRCQLGEVQCIERNKLNVHLERISERHYYRRTIQPLLSQILREWKMTAIQHKKQRQVLRRVLVHGASKLARRAMRKWIEFALISRRIQDMKEQTEHFQQTTQRLTSQHDQEQSSIREIHAHQLQKLMARIEEKDQELGQLKRQQRAETLKKAVTKTTREQDLLSFFERSIIKCDEQIAHAGDQLEYLLQTAEDDFLHARFGAAQFLVDSILQQKINNINECVRLQEAQLTMLSDSKDSKAHPSEDPTQDFLSELSSNGRYLYDMIQQRLTRLQQLHHSLAKVAAVSDEASTSLDCERLQHSNFLADALFQRQRAHISTVMTQFSRLGRASPAARA